MTLPPVGRRKRWWAPNGRDAYLPGLGRSRDALIEALRRCGYLKL